MARFEVRYARTTDAVNIAYISSGTGPVVLTSGAGMPMTDVASPLWESVAFFYEEILQGRYRLAMYDARGCGSSDTAPPDLSLEAQILDVDAVLDAINADGPAVLWVNGLSGAVGVAYAALRPHRVAGLILHDALVRGSDLINPLEVRGLLQLARHDPEAFAQVTRRMSVGWSTPDSPVAQTMVELVTAYASDTARLTMLFEMLGKIDANSMLGSVKVPTLVMWERDQNVLYAGEFARTLATSIPGARLAITRALENTLPSPEFQEHVRRFIEQVLPPPADSLAHSYSNKGTSDIRTILFTDLEGHTVMMSRLGDQRGRAVLREHERLTREALAAHGGIEVKTMGDGFLASFASTQRALDCAVGLQRAVAGGIAGEQLRIRIGINAGEPIAEDDDLFGTSVIAAARIAAKAEGGEVLVANVVRELVAGKGFLFNDRGPLALKGLDEPVRVWALKWD